MSRTYKATGINLKSMPLGEADRLLTILTRERGLVRAVAHGARKPKSTLGGRSSLFVVNTLLLAQGRSLDKISQAETLVSFPGLSQNLAKLTISQYWGELVLAQALSEQPQTELFDWFCHQLAELETMSCDRILTQFLTGILQLLHWSGITPQVYACCITQVPLNPNHQPADWQVGFSPSAGGAVSLSAWHDPNFPIKGSTLTPFVVADSSDQRSSRQSVSRHRLSEHIQLNALELQLLQALMQGVQPAVDIDSAAGSIASDHQYTLAAWMTLERALRNYAQYHFERPIRSAALINTCFVPHS